MPRGCKQSKTKSGCRTCKIRRIKCDESRPACQKCTATGRTCDGYGIWDSRGNIQPYGASRRLPLVYPSSPISNYVLNNSERAHLAWFYHRTVKKIPGLFRSTFWDGLVLQACEEESAVLHAVIALGSAHKLEGIRAAPRKAATQDLADSESIILKHYNAAIRLLHPFFVTQGKSSIRIILIICMVFTTMEFLLGRYRTGEKHLQNGMRLIRNLVGDYNIDLDASRDGADDKLLETFANMNLHCILFGQGVRGMYRAKKGFDEYPLPVMFESMAQARKRLDWLLSDTLRLTHKLLQASICDGPVIQPSEDLVLHQLRIKTQLSSWRSVFKVSRVSIITQMGVGGQLAYMVLTIYYIMTYIMASACLHASGEMAFDAYADEFLTIVNQSLAFREAVFASDFKDTHLEHFDDVSYFITDRGIIAPLYFTAIKCRVPCIRNQALKLLTFAASKEGLLDAKIATNIAKEIWNIEEGKPYEASCTETNPKPVPLIKATGFEPPTIPNSRRISNMQILLPDSANDKTTIICHQSEEILVREYNPIKGTWDSADPKNINFTNF